MNKDVVLRIAKFSEAEAIHGLMKSVYDNMPDKTLFFCDDLEYVKNSIDKEGFVVVACNPDSGKIVANLIVRHPDEDNLGLDINLPTEELSKVIHMESAVVSADYRGQGLQYRLMEYAEKFLRSEGKHKYLMATVSPYNPASYKTV